jgi:hypothetical protein
MGDWAAAQQLGKHGCSARTRKERSLVVTNGLDDRSTPSAGRVRCRQGHAGGGESRRRWLAVQVLCDPRGAPQCAASVTSCRPWLPTNWEVVTPKISYFWLCMKNTK